MSKSFLRFSFAVLAVFVMVASSFSCGADIISGVTFAPDDGATDEPLDVTVTVVFSREVSEMGPWSQYLFLRKDNAGDNLCTGYNFGGDMRTLQCLHDDLEPATNYTIVISFPQASGGTSTFTTASS